MGRMDKKKAAGKGMSPILRIALYLLGIAILYFGILGLTYLPGTVRPLDFAVREATQTVLENAFPNYDIATVAANPRVEKDNLLTIAFLKNEEIKAYIAQNQLQNQQAIQLPFNKMQVRIRELFAMPVILLVLLFLFSPIQWIRKTLLIVGSSFLLIFLITLKLRGILLYEITNTYAPQNLDGPIRMVPYLSAPGLVFAVVFLLWLIGFLWLGDRKKIETWWS